MAYDKLYGFLGFWSFLIMIAIYIFAFLVHEFSKVIIANTISKDCVTKGVPLSNFIEPVGFLLMMFYGVGWSRNAEINALYFKNRKNDTLKIYLGAVISNIVIGIIIISLAWLFAKENFILQLTLITLGQVVMAVGVMNLLPVTPFSGYKIFCEILSPNGKMKLIANEKMLQMIVIMLVFFDVIGTGVNNIVDSITKIITMYL